MDRAREFWEDDLVTLAGEEESTLIGAGQTAFQKHMYRKCGICDNEASSGLLAWVLAIWAS